MAQPDPPLSRAANCGFAGVVLLALCAAVPAAAQEYPARAVRMIVPLVPGGSVDTLARVLAQKLGESLGRQFVVDNRGGASGNIGTEIVARAAPDGYTLMTVSMTLVVNPFLFDALPFDVERDLAPISLIGAAPLVLVTHPSVQAASVQELLALAKKQPGRLNYASGGKGTNSHLPMELFKNLTGANIVHVPYRGGGPAQLALIAGEADVMFVNVLATASYREDRQAAAARGLRQPALEPAARSADHRRSRRRRLRIHDVVRRARAGRNAPSDYPHAACAHRQRRAHAGTRAALRRRRRRRRGFDAGAVRRAHQIGAGALAQGGEVCRGPARRLNVAGSATRAVRPADKAPYRTTQRHRPFRYDSGREPSTSRNVAHMSIISPWYQLGYVIPHLYTDLDAYQFYRVAPEGMMLLTTGLNLKDYTLAAVETRTAGAVAALRSAGEQEDRPPVAQRRAGRLGARPRQDARNSRRGRNAHRHRLRHRSRSAHRDARSTSARRASRSPRAGPIQSTTR